MPAPSLPSFEFLRRSLGRFWRHESALAITEYGLLIAFIALIVVAVLVVMGGQLASWFGTKTTVITTN